MNKWIPIGIGIGLVSCIVLFILWAAFYVAKYGMPDSYFKPRD